MPTISFIKTSSTTYKYYSGDYGGFRAFASEGANVDPVNITYTWTRNGAPILDAEYTDYTTYNAGGVARPDVGKATTFGVNSPVIMTPPLLKENDGDVYACTAIHNQGGNTIVHSITVDFEEEDMYLNDTRRSEYIEGNPAGGSVATGWRSAYWDRLGTAGEVIQYGRLLVNIASALAERNIIARVDGTLRELDTTNNPNRAITGSGIPTIGGVTYSLQYSNLGDFESAEGLRAHSADNGQDSHVVGLGGYVPATAPLSARVMNGVMDWLVAVGCRFTETSASNNTQAPAPLTPAGIMALTGTGVVPSEELTDYEDLSVSSYPPLIPPASEALVDDGILLTSDNIHWDDSEATKLIPLDSRGTPILVIDNGIATGIDAPYPFYMLNMMEWILSESFGDLSIFMFNDVVDASYVYGTKYRVITKTHALKGENIVTVPLKAGEITPGDPEAVNGTLIKAAHFTGIKDAISAMQRAVIDARAFSPFTTGHGFFGEFDEGTYYSEDSPNIPVKAEGSAVFSSDSGIRRVDQFQPPQQRWVNNNAPAASLAAASTLNYDRASDAYTVNQFDGDLIYDNPSPASADYTAVDRSVFPSVSGPAGSSTAVNGTADVQLTDDSGRLLFRQFQGSEGVAVAAHTIASNYEMPAAGGTPSHISSDNLTTQEDYTGVRVKPVSYGVGLQAMPILTAYGKHQNNIHSDNPVFPASIGYAAMDIADYEVLYQVDGSLLWMRNSTWTIDTDPNPDELIGTGSYITQLPDDSDFIGRPLVSLDVPLLGAEKVGSNDLSIPFTDIVEFFREEHIVSGDLMDVGIEYDVAATPSIIDEDTGWSSHFYGFPAPIPVSSPLNPDIIPQPSSLHPNGITTITTYSGDLFQSISAAATADFCPVTNGDQPGSFLFCDGV